uniref:Uncharacterized protein n=3 Tax=Avena sativa TaxID=4498 RepID=A0ACD5XFI2_AVESA
MTVPNSKVGGTPYNKCGSDLRSTTIRTQQVAGTGTRRRIHRYTGATSSRNGNETKNSEMGLWVLLEGFLLLANSLAILNEDRFLGPRGWSMSEVSGNGQTKSLKGQIVGLIYATQFLRMPLIALNILIIVVKLVSG